MEKIFSNSKLFLAAAVLCVIGLAGVLSSCNVSTANLTEVKVCSSLNGSECSNDVSSFPGDVPAIYCSASLNNAPADTNVTFEWKQEGVSIGKVELNAESGFVNSTFKPTSTLEPGKYSVSVKLATDNATPITKEFTIE
ncbi:MAG: hypothetical protein WC139_02240 [Candidatus Kapaibacterium sp.]